MSGFTVDRVVWHPQVAIERVGADVDRAAEAGGHFLLDAADRRVPYDQGTLAGSGVIERGDGAEVAVGYTDPVAKYVHAHPEWDFQGGRSGRWLEEAMTDEAFAIEELVTESIRAGWPE